MIFADQPIAKSADDTLHRRRFVDQLAEAILAWSLQEPLVIGIYGHWGDGKSSALYLLEEKLRDKALVTFFDPWYFNSQEELIRIFFSDIFRAISQKLPFFSKRKFHATAQSLTNTLTSFPLAINFGGVDFSLRDWMAEQANPSNQKKELSKYLAERRKYDKRKIVVLVDNLDRLAPDEILLMLKLVRLCSDFEDMVYVLAFDDNYVIQAIDRVLETRAQGITGEEYLKKIVQTDVRLPAIDSQTIDKFVDRAFDELQDKLHIEWDEDFRHRFPPFYEENMSGKLLRNLRDAKKLVNAVAFSLPLVIGEVNYADWLVMEALRVFCPLAYAAVRDNIELLSPDYGKLAFRPTEHEIREVSQLFQNFMETISSSKKEFSLAAVEYLFPIYAAWRFNHSNIRAPTQDSYAQFTTLQRIASPDYKHAYFQFGPEPDRLPDTRVTEFINDINRAEEDNLPTLIPKKIRQFQEEKHLTSLFDKLILRANRIERRLDKAFIEAIASLAHIYARRQRDYFEVSEHDRAKAFIYALVGQNQTAERVQSLLEISVEKASTDGFAMNMFVFSSPEHNRIITDFRLINFESLKLKLRDRLRMRFVVENMDIFALPRDDYAYILSQWAGPTVGDATEVMKYLSNQFRTRPIYIGKFLEIFITDRSARDEVQWHFEFRRHEQVFSVEWLRGIIAELSENNVIFESERQRWALEQFQSHYPAMPSNSEEKASHTESAERKSSRTRRKSSRTNRVKPPDHKKRAKRSK